MVKNSLHFIFNISSEKLHENQIMVSFDVEWMFTTIPVKETVQVLLIKLESDHETKPFDPMMLTPSQIAYPLDFLSRSQ